MFVKNYLGLWGHNRIKIMFYVFEVVCFMHHSTPSADVDTGQSRMTCLDRTASTPHVYETFIGPLARCIIILTRCRL